MKNLTRIKAEMFKIVEDPRTSTFAKIEAAKVIAACAGVLLPDTSESYLSTKQAVELRQAKQAIAARMLKRKERRQLENRRQYLKRKLRNRQVETVSQTQPEQNGGIS